MYRSFKRIGIFSELRALFPELNLDYGFVQRIFCQVPWEPKIKRRHLTKKHYHRNRRHTINTAGTYHMFIVQVQLRLVRYGLRYYWLIILIACQCEVKLAVSKCFICIKIIPCSGESYLFLSFTSRLIDLKICDPGPGGPFRSGRSLTPDNLHLSQGLCCPCRHL